MHDSLASCSRVLEKKRQALERRDRTHALFFSFQLRFDGGRASLVTARGFLVPHWQTGHTDREKNEKRKKRKKKKEKKGENCYEYEEESLSPREKTTKIS